MDIKQLKYFLTIAKEGKITSAAKKLNMAQPPLSYHLKLLEEELGVKLMDRGSHKIHLTSAGQILANRAEQILKLVSFTTKELKDFKEGAKGTLSIGTVSSSGATLLPERINTFHKEYPGVNFNVWEGNTFRILEILNSGLIEVGIVRTPFNTEGLEITALPKEPMTVVFNKESDLFEHKESVNLKDLKGRPLIIYKRFEKLIFECCNREGFVPNIVCNTEDARTALLWAEAGIGIAIVPKTSFDVVKNVNLKRKRIDEANLETSIAAICVKNRYISSVARNFLHVFSMKK